MHGARNALLAGVAALGLALVQLPPPATARAAAMPSDFDGDGYADLAIGVPGEGVGSKAGAGAVNVLYGSRRGLTATGDQYWTLDSPGVKGRSVGGGELGWSVASGDFDRDGYADLAIGEPHGLVGGKRVRAGAVSILYGSRRGLTAAGDQRWSQANLPNSPRSAEVFGWAVAAGDLNGDGYSDLAIGVPRQSGTGRVHVLFGGPDGLTATGSMVLARAWTGAGDSRGAWFGAALAAGDLDGDGTDDLAVGAFHRSDGPGDVSVFYGSAAGPTPAASELWSQDSPGIAETAEDGDHFGWALDVGDFDADGFGDLAIGAPGEGLVLDATSTQAFHVGVVHVVRGSADGLTAAGSQLWHQDLPGEPGAKGWAQRNDEFGYSLAAGDFDGDRADDLAIGVIGDGAPSPDPYSTAASGAVDILYGSVTGLTAAGSQLWSQASPGIAGKPDGEQFGKSLASANYGRSFRADLAIGAEEESLGGKDSAGRVHVLYGRTTGLNALHAQTWTQNSPGVKGRAEYGDYFGASLTP